MEQNYKQKYWRLTGKGKRKYRLCILLYLLAVCSIKAQLPKWLVTDSALLLPAAQMQKWENCKFGLFIHYGLYSILGKGEWVQFNEQIPLDEYAKLENRFHPKPNSAQRWVQLAKEAGCKYMVLTTRHHDGFALFDSKSGDFNAMQSPAHIDLVKSYTQACRKAGLLVGLYYSPLDWRFPGFFFPDLYRQSAEKMKKQTYTQVRELLSNYGDINILWYDGGGDDWLGFGGLYYTGSAWKSRDRLHQPYKGGFHWDPVKLNTMVRNLQPNVIINSRSGIVGDFDIMEAAFSKRVNTKRPWEMCTTIQQHGWGYVNNVPIKTADSCIKLLAKVVCMNGNLLLNVGPKADGDIDARQAATLRKVGDWLHKYGESIYNTRGGIWNEAWGGTTTAAGKTYVHVLKLDSTCSIILPAIKGKINHVTNLLTNTPVKFVQNEQSVILYSLAKKVTDPDLVIQIAY